MVAKDLVPPVLDAIDRLTDDQRKAVRATFRSALDAQASHPWWNVAEKYSQRKIAADADDFLSTYLPDSPVGSDGDGISDEAEHRAPKADDENLDVHPVVQPYLVTLDHVGVDLAPVGQGLLRSVRRRNQAVALLGSIDWRSQFELMLTNWAVGLLDEGDAKDRKHIERVLRPHADDMRRWAHAVTAAWINDLSRSNETAAIVTAFDAADSRARARIQVRAAIETRAATETLVWLAVAIVVISTFTLALVAKLAL
jgi:hypothetical protein